MHLGELTEHKCMLGKFRCGPSYLLDCLKIVTQMCVRVYVVNLTVGRVTNFQWIRNADV